MPLQKQYFKVTDSEKKKKKIANVTSSALDKSNSLHVSKNKTGIMGLTTTGGISSIGLTTFINGQNTTAASSNIINKSGANST